MHQVQVEQIHERVVKHGFKNRVEVLRALDCMNPHFNLGEAHLWEQVDCSIKVSLSVI